METSTKTDGKDRQMTGKRTAYIQTLSSLGGWDTCEYTSWKELKEDGWVFEHLTPEGWVTMSRKGYLNTFRNDPTMEDYRDVGKGWIKREVEQNA